MYAAIDADQMIYAAGFATEGEPIAHTLQVVKKKLTSIIEETESDSWQVYIKGEGNFRDRIAIDYKAHRPLRVPSAYEDTRKYLIEEWNACEVNGMEADDAVSLILWHDYYENNGDKDACQAIIVSPDKDLNNTPGWHYDPNKKIKKFINNQQALRHFCYQMLMGDAADNIKGLPYLPEGGKRKLMGPAGAKKLLGETQGARDAMNVVHNAYERWGEAEEEANWEDYFYQVGQLLWMTRELLEPETPRLFSLTHYNKLAYIE